MSRSLECAGVDRAALLQRARIDGALVDEPDGHVLAPTVFRLWRAARALDPSSDLGVRAGAAAPAGVFEIIEYLFSTSSTVGEGLSQFSRYFAAVATNMVGWELHGGETAAPEFRFRTRLPSRVFPAVMRDFAMSAAITRVRHWTGGVVPTRVDVVGPGLTSEDAYREMYRAPVRLRQEHNRVVFAPEDWRRELPNRDPVLATLVRRHADKLVDDAPQPSLDGLVRSEVAMMLGAREPDRAAVAKKLGMSDRSLHRHLADAGTSWSEIVDDTRRQMALECLAEPSLSIGEVGLLLGYSEPSAFTRAFRRWTGRSPSVHRRARR